MLTKKLTREEQSELLGTLFGFSFDGDILIDDNGNEFYATPYNCQFDFSTLAGVFAYAVNRAKNNGYSDCQHAMCKVLGLT
jgi:hypothetical protein